MPGNRKPLGFRTSIIRRLKRLLKHGKLIFTGKHEHLNDPVALTRHLANNAPAGYRVFVQHAPDGCKEPTTVVKYLARYVSGGPISDKRIASAENGKVTFLVRDNDSALPGQRKSQVEVTVPETEFLRRWALHILPKGFVRVRNYGHASPSNRRSYLARCRELLGIDQSELAGTGDREPNTNESEFKEAIDALAEDVEDEDGFEMEVFGGVSLDCPQCGQPMKCVSFSYRRSWRDIMSGPDRPSWYES